MRWLQGLLLLCVCSLCLCERDESVRRLLRTAPASGHTFGESIALGGEELSVIIDSATGGYRVMVAGVEWFASGNSALFANGSWLEAGEELALSAAVRSEGEDNLGRFVLLALWWEADGIKFVNTFRSYQAADGLAKPFLLFGQYFPTGVEGSSLGDYDAPMSHFPVLNSTAPDELAYLHFFNQMGGDEWQCAKWPTVFQSGIAGGPIAWFDEAMNSTVIYSTFSQFTSVISTRTSAPSRRHPSLVTGIQGNAESIPPWFFFESIMYRSPHGLNAAMMEWGDVMLARHNKIRPTPLDTSSIYVKYLGYSTTGFYFYNPLQGTENQGDYQETLIAVHEYSDSLAIPFRYYLVDSFWYGEQIFDTSVWLWENNRKFLRNRFPDGLDFTRNALDAPLAAHMGRWSSSSPYVLNEEYEFIREGKVAIPQSIKFWDHIFTNASAWGLNLLKQDHMNEQIEKLNASTADVAVLRNWLLQQGESASSHGIDIMYCMDFPMIALNSLELTSPVASRAGNDYLPKWAPYNWKIQTTSMFLWSLGLFPYKDTFYTSTDERVLKSSSKFFNFTEPYPMTHALSAIYSAGPLATSDGINHANLSVITRTCRQDGLLLKPDRPAVPTDRFWRESVFEKHRIFPTGYRSTLHGAAYVTFTSYAVNLTWHYVLAVNLQEDTLIYPGDLLREAGDSSNATFYAASFQDSPSPLVAVSLCSPSTPLQLPQGVDYGDYDLRVLAPLSSPSASFVFFGELNDKLVPVSKQRFPLIQAQGDSLLITVAGVEGESVLLVFYSLATSTPVTYSCVLPSSGRALFKYPGVQCVPA